MSDHAATQVWRMVSGILAATVVTGASAFLVQAKNTVTRPDVSQMIALESPYTNDRSMILQQLADIKTQIGQINAKLDRERK